MKSGMPERVFPETLCVSLDASTQRPFVVDTSDGNCHVGISYVRADLIEEYLGSLGKL